MNRSKERAQLEAQKKILSASIDKFLRTPNTGAKERLFLALIDLHTDSGSELSDESKRLLRFHGSETMADGLAALQTGASDLFDRRFRVLSYYATTYLHHFIAKYNPTDDELMKAYRIGMTCSLYAPLPEPQSVSEGPASHTPHTVSFEKEKTALRKCAREALLGEDQIKRINGQMAFDYAVEKLAECVIPTLGNVHPDYKIPIRGTYTRPVADRRLPFWQKIRRILGRT